MDEYDNVGAATCKDYCKIVDVSWCR